MTSILGPGDGPPAEIVNRNGRAAICLVCEHASSLIPAALGDLGLAAEDRYSHAVWDIGAEALARRMSALLDAPLVVARVSRLVYDLNRPPEAPGAMPRQSGEIAVPGNRNISDAERAQRTAEVYGPFHAAVSSLLDAFAAPPVFVTVHSFTPVWDGQKRETELGLLHDEDARLAKAMLHQAETTLRVELNKPYSVSDGVMHTVQKHATARGLDSVMIEVRNDLLGSETDIDRMADTLVRTLTRALAARVSAA